MTNRTPIIAGNWKMHNTLAESADLITALTKAGNKNNVEIIVAPSYTSLAKVAELAKGSEIQVAAQDVHWEDKGAFTSAVSPVQAKDAGAALTLIGHSERRSVFGDTDEILNKKVAKKQRRVKGLNFTLLCFLVLFAVFLFNVLLVLCNLALTNMGKAVVLVVLTVVETHTLAVFRHAHRDDLVDEPVAEVANRKCIDNYNCHGN